MIEKDKLRSVIKRIECLEEEKRAIAEDIKEVYAEAKGMGFVPKIIRKIVALRRIDPHKREEEASLMGLYMHALGMTPIERLAMDRGEVAGLENQAKAAVSRLVDVVKKERNGIDGITISSGESSVSIVADDMEVAE